MQRDLAEFIEKVRELGFMVKLDTNGANFEVVEELARRNLVDYFAIDIKTAFYKYDLVSAPRDGAEMTLRSVDLIIDKNIPLELRTTVVPGIVGLEDFDDIIRALREKNENILPRLSRYNVQTFRPQKCLDKKFEELSPYDDEVLEQIAEKLKKYCTRVEVVR